jgi:serine/threonine protein kinase
LGYQQLNLSVLHNLHIVHTDLKPENILFKNLLPSDKDAFQFAPEIRIIDFGLATRPHDYHDDTVSTRPYRAPEVILRQLVSCFCLHRHLYSKKGGLGHILAIYTRLDALLPNYAPGAHFIKQKMTLNICQ